MASEQRIYVNFSFVEQESAPEETFDVISFEGTEAISEPFRFDIELISNDPDLDLESLVGKPALLEFSRDENVRKVHGIVSLLEQGEETQFDHYRYRAVLVPRMWFLTLSRQNQIYQDKNVTDIVTEELLNGDYCGDLLSDDLDLRLSESYPVREYIVQYQETDLNFVDRLLEHEGIYYYFDHQDERDKVVFCDDKSKLDPVDEKNVLPYVPPSGMAAHTDEAIHGFTLKQAQITREVLLRDFNYRTPHLNQFQGDAETNDLGYGRVCQYGDHFKTLEEGDKYASIRAQMHTCRQKTCQGNSDALGMQAGKLFEMTDHYRDSHNGEYIVTRIFHRGGQSISGMSGQSQSGETIAYQNSFEAIPASVEFRPELKTHKPKMYGILNAIVDGEGDSDRAQIDDQGRYKIKLPFDIGGSADGKASRWVRKAETYGGQGTGMHFPLLKGTEVVWSCIDGDPDRPIITGVVANPHNQSVVNSGNFTRNVIKTPGGTIMTMDDGPSGSSGSGGGGTEQHQSKVAAQANNSAVDRAASSIVSQKNQPSTQLQQQQQYSAVDVENREGAAGGGGLTNGQKMFSLVVDDYNGSGDDAYFRMGYPDNSSYESDLGYANKADAAGILMASHGSIRQKSYKNFFSQTTGISFSQNLSSSATYARGYSAGIKVAGSTNIDATYGLNMGLGLNAKFTVGSDVSINYGIQFSSGTTKKYENIKGKSVLQAKDILIRASTYDGKTDALDKVLGGGTVLAGIAAAGTTIASVPTEVLTWSDSDINTGFLTASGVSSATAVAGSVGYAVKKIIHEHNELKTQKGKESFIAMDNDSLVLSCDGSSIVINGEGVFINGKTFALGQLPGGAGSKEFSPNKGELEHAKVGKIYPEFVNLNATKRVDIRSQDMLYLSANEKNKMESNVFAEVDASKMKTYTLPPPVPPSSNKSGQLQLTKGGEANLCAGGKLTLTSGTDTLAKAKGGYDVKTSEAKFSGKVTATGELKGSNFGSGN